MAGKKRKQYNILYTTSFASMMGGGQWSLYYLIRHLNKDIFHPIVLCPGEGELAEKMRGAGAEVMFFDVGRIRYLNPLVIKKFISLIKEKQIALIHTDSTTETFYCGIAARMMRIPLVWHIRVSDREWFLDRILSLLSTRLILVANAIRRRFAWLTDTPKMIVVYNGIDLEEFDHFSAIFLIREEFNISKETVLLGCIGRIEKRKGQEYLISAMRHIDGAKLILIGGGEEGFINKLKKISAAIGISDRIIFTGHRDDIPAVLKEIDILVCPSTSEGFSRVLLEAMAARRPVIATDVAGNPEAVVDGITGYIVPTSNSAALATRIDKLVGNKEKREEMGNAGRRRVETLFVIESNVRKIEEIYFKSLKRIQ